LTDLVSSIPSYTPNEAELTTASLTTFHASLQTANTNVINAEVTYSNARISRDNVLYAENTGLVDIASDVKKYVKAIFGATSPQYKQVSRIKFTKP
jgi:regulator of RNase E activity RraA